MKIKHIDIPIPQLVLSIIVDILDVIYPPVGYATGFVADTYLYFWAKKYIGESDVKKVNEFKNKIKSSYFLRILAEYIPFLNFLPISTLFVINVWKDKQLIEKKKREMGLGDDVKHLEVEELLLKNENRS